MENFKKEGIILVDKPKNITSHDVVDFVRKKLGIKKVGHAGTLDPLADGLLIILVGSYTKLFPKFVSFDKEYRGMLKLGEVTTTGDSQGKIILKKDYQGISESNIRQAFSSFVGEIEQIPPMVSALRVKGKRLYNLARKGIVIQRQPRRIKIYDLKIVKIEMPFIEFYARCSKGTYIRKLAEDIGEVLGCGAHIVEIRRISIGHFQLNDAVNLQKIDESYLQKVTL
jgi:tRNA pseudouridine55 synthase